MKIFITGGTGFVGRHLCKHFIEDGHHVIAVARSYEPESLQAQIVDHPNFTYIAADTTRAGDWQGRLSGCDAAVNLAGKSIFTLWTDKAKRQIYDSRVKTTRNLVEALSPDGRTTLVNASAVGYYGDRGDETLSETEPPGDDFLASLAKDWEGEALKARQKGTRVVLTRFGIVLGKGGGAMEMMIPVFRMFMGGRLGSGKQWFPWVHIHDLTAAVRFVIDRPSIEGAVNFCAPNPVRNEDLAAALGEKLDRPAMLPAPSIAVKGLLGEFGEALLCSQRARPEVLMASDFAFAYPDIRQALDQIVGS